MHVMLRFVTQNPDAEHWKPFGHAWLVAHVTSQSRYPGE
jgi:hypothetical protein